MSQKAAQTPKHAATPDSVAFEDVEAAAARIAGAVERTPLRRSRTLSEITGADVWIKFENLQFVAAFKERGALNKLLMLSETERAAGVITVSAGNHAQGVAYHSSRLGVPATIVMPRGTPFVKIEQTRRFGVRVVLEGETFADATEYAYALGAREGLTLIHPYDDPLVIAGQGTIALEMLAKQPDFDCILVPVGGGGLIAGMSIATERLAPKLEIVGVEAAMYPCLWAALRNEAPVCGGQTIAEGIAVKQVGDLPLALVRSRVRDVVLVQEDQIEQAVTLFATIEKTVAEGAGAAGLAALLAEPDRFRGKKVGLVLTGGNIDSRLLASVLTRALVREGRISSLRLIGDDRPGLLARVSQTIGDYGGNIIEIVHNRLALDVPAKGAEFDIMIETQDAQHTAEIIAALTALGYPPRPL